MESKNWTHKTSLYFVYTPKWEIIGQKSTKFSYAPNEQVWKI